MEGTYQFCWIVGSKTCTPCSTSQCTTIGSITSSPSSPSKVSFNMTILDGDGNPMTIASPFVVGWVYVGLFGGFVLVSGVIALIFQKETSSPSIDSSRYSSHPRGHFAAGRFFEQTCGRTILLSRDCWHLGFGWRDSGDCLPNRHFHHPRENGTYSGSARNSPHQWFLNILGWDPAHTFPGPLSDSHNL